MAEHSERGEQASQHAAPDTPDTRGTWDGRTVGGEILATLAAAAAGVGVVFALGLVVHVVFVLTEANPDHSIVATIRNWAQWISLGFTDLFLPVDAKLRVLINYGIAAVFWLGAGLLVATLLRRISRALSRRAA